MTEITVLAEYYAVKGMITLNLLRPSLEHKKVLVKKIFTESGEYPRRTHIKRVCAESFGGLG